VEEEEEEEVRTSGEAGLDEKLASTESSERRLLGRLEDDRVAASESGRDLPREHQQREIPGDVGNQRSRENQTHTTRESKEESRREGVGESSRSVEGGE